MTLVEHLHHFFQTKEMQDWSSSRPVMILRRDGQVLFRYPYLREDDASIGALMSGAWQAATVLAGFVDAHTQEQDFRLSFDTSSTGMFMLPFQKQEHHLYMGVLYKNELNSAKLKNKLRALRDELDLHLNKHTPLKGATKAVPFENITDDEIDKIFSPIGC